MARARVAMWPSRRGGRPRCVPGWTPGCDAGDCCVALLRGSAETWLSRLAESRGVTGHDVVVSRRSRCVTCRCVAPTRGASSRWSRPLCGRRVPWSFGGGCRRVSWLWATPRVLTAGVVSTSQTVPCGDCLSVLSRGCRSPFWRPTSQDSHTGCAVGCPPLQAMWFHRVCG